MRGFRGLIVTARTGATVCSSWLVLRYPKACSWRHRHLHQPGRVRLGVRRGPVPGAGRDRIGRPAADHRVRAVGPRDREPAGRHPEVGDRRAPRQRDPHPGRVLHGRPRPRPRRHRELGARRPAGGPAGRGRGHPPGGAGRRLSPPALSPRRVSRGGGPDLPGPPVVGSHRPVDAAGGEGGGWCIPFMHVPAG